MFLGSFSDPFQRVERNKNKRKNRQKIWMKCKTFRNIVYFLKLFSVSQIFTFFNDQCTDRSEKQQINLVWPNSYHIEYDLKCYVDGGIMLARVPMT